MTADPPDRPLVIGVGTEHRRDDRCGLDVVRGLARRGAGRFRIAEASSDATRLLDLWEHEAIVWVVDAVRSGRPPGELRTIALAGDGTGSSSTTSTHGLSVAEAIALGRAPGRMPGALTLCTIEVGDVGMGDGLSAPVAAAVGRLTEALAAALDRGAEAPHA
ncbi:MAG: hydrogenase maturation protease [Thermoplasmata archaeon]|nr:hydrogenase maturation protease [Thermoplasmata archaeon]